MSLVQWKMTWAVSFCAVLVQRAPRWGGLMNLTYNLKRIETLIRLKVLNFDRIDAPVAQAIA